MTKLSDYFDIKCKKCGSELVDIEIENVPDYNYYHGRDQILVSCLNRNCSNWWSQDKKKNND